MHICGCSFVFVPANYLHFEATFFFWGGSCNPRLQTATNNDTAGDLTYQWQPIAPLYPRQLIHAAPVTPNAASCWEVGTGKTAGRIGNRCSGQCSVPPSPAELRNPPRQIHVQISTPFFILAAKALFLSPSSPRRGVDVWSRLAPFCGLIVVNLAAERKKKRKNGRWRDGFSLRAERVGSVLY